MDDRHVIVTIPFKGFPHSVSKRVTLQELLDRGIIDLDDLAKMETGETVIQQGKHEAG